MKIQVIAHANSKNTKIVEDEQNNLHFYVREHAIENKANIAIRNALAEKYGVSKSSVVLIKGVKSKKKLFNVDL